MIKLRAFCVSLHSLFMQGQCGAVMGSSLQHECVCVFVSCKSTFLGATVLSVLATCPVLEARARALTLTTKLHEILSTPEALYEAVSLLADGGGEGGRR